MNHYQWYVSQLSRYISTAVGFLLSCREHAMGNIFSQFYKTGNWLATCALQSSVSHSQNLKTMLEKPSLPRYSYYSSLQILLFMRGGFILNLILTLMVKCDILVTVKDN